MSIVRSYIDRDSWITDSATGANYGLSPILEVWNKYNREIERKEWARSLVRFSLTSVENDIKVSGLYPDPRTDNSVSAYIYMFNAPHGDNQATDFNIWAFPLTANWIEGSGLDNDKYSHTGAVNAIYATTTQKWEDISNAVSGGDAYIGHSDGDYDSNSASMYFENGEENLKLDVTNWFKDYLDGSSANYGFIIRMGDAEESKTAADAITAGVDTSVTSTSFFTKKFYSKETNTRKRPYLQLEWPGAVKDDRKNLKFSKTADLYYYNVVDGVYEDIDGTNKFPGYVTLSADGVLVEPANLTASRVSKGIYKINVGTAQNDLEEALTGINISLSSSSRFTDTWSVTSDGFTTSQIFDNYPTLPNTGSEFVNTSNFQVTILNAKSDYERGFIGKIRVFVKNRATVLSAVTGSSTSMNSFIVKSGTVQIREKATDLIEVDDLELSYDSQGNYFELNTYNLYPSIEYKIVLKLYINNETIYLDYPEKWNFNIL